jgi:hypothetical protein
MRQAIRNEVDQSNTRLILEQGRLILEWGRNVPEYRMYRYQSEHLVIIINQIYILVVIINQILILVVIIN